MRGDRHMATSRSHNRVHRSRGGGKGLSKAERAARANSIHNRGDIMNPAEQKRQATLKEELGNLAAASAEEFRAVDARMEGLKREIATLHNLLRQTFNEERTARLQLAEKQRRYVDDQDGLLLRTITAFLKRGWRDRLRWIFLGN